MRLTAFILTAAIAATATVTARSGDWEALASETQALTGAKHIMVTRVGKKDAGEPLASAIVAAHQSKLQERGYEGPSVKLTGMHSAVWPEFKDIDDVKEWLKDGHEVRTRSGSEGKFGGAAGVATLVSSAIKHKAALEGVLAVEAREVGAGAKKKIMSGLGKKLGVGGGKTNDAAVYETRLTLLNENGQVVWSEVAQVDKAGLEAVAEKNADKRMDEMSAVMEGKQKEMQAQTGGARQAEADKAMAQQLAGMTPEQRAMVEAAVKGANAQAGAMPPQSGMMKGMMKGMQTKPDLGGPENWGQPAAELSWEKLAAHFPKRS